MKVAAHFIASEITVYFIQVFLGSVLGKLVTGKKVARNMVQYMQYMLLDYILIEHNTVVSRSSRDSNSVLYRFEFNVQRLQIILLLVT